MRRACVVGLSVGVIVAVAASVSAASGRSSPIVAAWTQLGPSNRQDARVVVSGGDCPMLSLRSARGKSSVRMDVRADFGSNGLAFTDKVCQAEMPAGTTEASVPGHRLPLASKELRRIALLGDTGCANKKGQDCNDPNANAKGWPFAKVASSIASKHQPDVIIHLGDILYRHFKSDCQEGCSAGIDADFFTPAAPMLAAAPLVMVRGNHEGYDNNDCVGWFRYFAVGPALRPGVTDCTSEERFTSPYSIDLTAHQKLIILDTSFAPDKQCELEPKSECVEKYREAFEKANELATRPAWLISHVPLWDVAGGKGIEGGPNKLELALVGQRLSPNLRMVISGHLHQFEYLSFEPTATTLVPAQLILGNGGTYMSDAIPVMPGTAVDDVRVKEGYAESRFGYGVIQLENNERSSADPKSIKIKKVDGSPDKTCSLHRYELQCN